MKSWIKKVCYSPYHKPPGHFCVKPGQSYTHKCPACGQVTVISNNISHYKLGINHASIRK